MNIRICIVHYSSAPGGIEVLLPVIMGMHPDIDYSIFILRPPGRECVNVYENAVPQPHYGSLNNFVAAWKLWRFGIKNRTAIFHGFNIGPFFLLVLRLAGIRKVAYSVHGTLHYSTSFQKVFRRAVWNLAIARKFRLIANSEYSRDVFLRFVRLKKIKMSVIYNPINSGRIMMAGAKTGDRPMTIIYVGRLSDGKNLFRWIDAAVAIHKVRSDSRFYLYGYGPLKEMLVNYSHETGADEYVRFKGYLSDISEAYNNVDLMIFISEFESFGNVVVESVLSGTPVIASDIPSMREIFRNFPQILVPLDENLERNIIDKVQQLDKLNTLIPEMIEEFKIRFSAKNHIEKLRSVYNSFID